MIRITSRITFINEKNLQYMNFLHFIEVHDASKVFDILIIENTSLLIILHLTIHLYFIMFSLLVLLFDYLHSIKIHFFLKKFNLICKISKESFEMTFFI